jgi:hypothetical protein
MIGGPQVASLARPDRNVTGVSILATELDLKRLEVLKRPEPQAPEGRGHRHPTG